RSPMTFYFDDNYGPAMVDKIAMARMSFDYGGVLVAPHSDEQVIVEGEILRVKRMPKLEQQWILELDDQDYLAPVGGIGEAPELEEAWTAQKAENWEKFMESFVPKLTAHGWRV